MARIPTWMIALLAGVAFLPGVRANAQENWAAATTGKAVAVCDALNAGPEAMMAKARAAGWSAFKKEVLADGLEAYSSSNTQSPISNNSAFVSLQVGTKTDNYPGIGRLRQRICNVGPPVSQKARLVAELNARFPGFSTSNAQWVGVRRGASLKQLAGAEAAQLQQTINQLAVGEGVIWVELNEERGALFGTLRLYEKLP